MEAFWKWLVNSGEGHFPPTKILSEEGRKDEKTREYWMRNKQSIVSWPMDYDRWFNAHMAHW